MKKNLPVMTRVANLVRGIGWGQKADGSISHPSQLLDLIGGMRGFRDSISGVKVSPQSVMAIAAVYACIRVISESLAMCPLRVFARLANGDREEAVDHPLWRIVQYAPNFYQTPMEFIEMMVGILLLRGNMYYYKNFVRQIIGDEVTPSGKLILKELLPIHPDRMEVKVKADYSVEYWVAPIGGGVPKQVPNELIMHVRGLSGNMFTGLEPVSVAADVFGNALAAQEHNARMFKNGARLSGVLTHPDELDDEAYARIKKSWADAYQGLENAFKVAILEEGMTWKEISMTSEQLQMVESRKLSWTEVCGLFRVQPHKLQILEKGAAFASIEQQNISFVVDTIQPWATRLEQRFNRDLLVAPQKYYFKFGLQALLRGDMAARKEFYASGITNGWLSRQEVRGFEDLNKGPKELESFLEPLNMAPAEQAAELRKRQMEKPGGVGSTAGSGDQPRNKPTSKEEKEARDEELKALASVLAKAMSIHVDARTTIADGAVQVHAPSTTTIAEGAVKSEVRTTIEKGAVQVHEQVSIQEGPDGIKVTTYKRDPTTLEVLETITKTIPKE